jgi:hypothetical protein
VPKLFVLLVDVFKATNAGISVRELHDAILACGSLSPRLIRQRLLGE